MNEDPFAGKWHKSTRSVEAGGHCVEVAETPMVIGVRDSKDPNGPVLRFGPDAWQAFVAGAKGGEFDLPGAA
jgi:hypothetical protein